MSGKHCTHRDRPARLLESPDRCVASCARLSFFSRSPESPARLIAAAEASRLRRNSWQWPGQRRERWHRGTAATDRIGGAAGVFGVPTGNAGGGSSAGNQDHGGARSGGDSGTTHPITPGRWPSMPATATKPRPRWKLRRSPPARRIREEKPSSRTARTPHIATGPTPQNQTGKCGFRRVRGRGRPPCHRHVVGREHLRHQARLQPHHRRPHLARRDGQEE